MSDIKERESTKTRSCGEGLSDRIGSRLQEFSGFKAAAHQTPISKSYDWLDSFLNRVNEQVQNYNSHFNSHDVSAGRRFRILDSIKKKSNTRPQIGGFSNDYFENIPTPWGTLGDLIFLDWLEEDDEEEFAQQESNSRIVNGWGNSASENQFIPASVSASPWLNTKYRSARVASKKSKSSGLKVRNRDKGTGKPTFAERSILRGLMADKYDQTVSFTDLPLSIQRNIQQELRDEVLESTDKGQYFSSKQSKKNIKPTKKYASSPLRREQKTRKNDSFASSRYAKRKLVHSSHATNRMQGATSGLTEKYSDSVTGLSPVLRNSPVVRYASNEESLSNIDSVVSDRNVGIPYQPTNRGKVSKNYSGIAKINSSKQSSVRSSVRGLSRQQQEVRNVRNLLSSIGRYNKTNKEDYIPSTFYSLMRGIDPDVSKGDLVDIIDSMSTEKINDADSAPIKKQVSSIISRNTSRTLVKRSRNNRKYGQSNSSPITMNSTDYASQRQRMWSKSNDRSILPTQSFLGAFDQGSDMSISGVEDFLSGLLSSEQKQNPDIGSSRSLKNIQNATERIKSGVGQNLSVKSRGSSSKKAPMNSLFYSAPELNSVVDHVGTTSEDSFEEGSFQASNSTFGENTTRNVNGWGNQNESRTSAWLSKDSPGARVVRSAKSSPVVEASSRQIVNVIEKILTKSLPITTTYSARKSLGSTLQRGKEASTRSSLRREMTKDIEAWVSQELKKSLSGSNPALQGITSDVLSSVFQDTKIKNILEKNVNYVAENSSQENKKQVSLLQSATKKNRNVIERGIVRELETNMSKISSSIRNQLQTEIQKELQSNNGRPLEEAQVQNIINRVQKRVEKNYRKSITKKVVDSQRDVIGAILGKEVAQQSKIDRMAFSDLGDFAEEVITAMGVENITQRSLLSATQKALTTQLIPSKNNKTRFSLPSSTNIIGQTGIKELQSYLSDNDFQSSSVQNSFEKRLSDIAGLSLGDIGANRLDTKMTTSQLKEVRSSLDSYAQDLFDRGEQFEALSKRFDSSLKSSMRGSRQSQLLRKNSLLLDDAFNVIVSETLSDDHADDILNGVTSLTESNRASAWFTNDVSSVQNAEQQAPEILKLTSMLTELKSINKNRSASSSRTLDYISDREKRAESVKKKRDSAFNDNGYNQNHSRKTRSIRHDSGVFVDAKYLEQSPSSFESTTEDQERFNKLPFSMTLEAMQYRSNDRSLPSWAKRSSEKPQIRGTSDIVQSLVRASSAGEVVDALFDRGDSLTTNLPKGASKVIEGIRKEAHKLERQLSESTLVAQSRMSDDGRPQRRKTRSSAKVIQGFQGLTPFQEAQAEEQKASDTKLQKLTKQLEDLILIAEHQGRDAARQGVRMSVDAPEEEGSRGDTPGELNRDEQVDLEALINHVYFEITERLRQEEDLFNFDNDSFKRGGY